jgi:hypothetical protein
MLPTCPKHRPPLGNLLPNDLHHFHGLLAHLIGLLELKYFIAYVNRSNPEER